jgi:hypothetical protein
VARVLRALRTGAFVFLTLSLAGCGSCSHESAPSAADAMVAPVAAEPPVPAPDGLAVEAYLATPDALWTRLQRGVGGAAAILPASFAGLVLTFTGVDPTVAFEVDGTKPAFALVAEREAAKDRAPLPADAPPSWALAMPLANARHTEDALLGADGARYTAKDVAPGLRALASKGGAPLTLAVGLAKSGWLIVASSDADLVRLAPYAYRTMPTKPLPQGAPLVAIASHDGLAGPLRVRLAALWNQEKDDLLASADQLQEAHDGGAPDFADPPAILALLDAAVQRRLSMLGDLAELRFELDATADDVRLEAVAPPTGPDAAAAKALAALSPGDARPLLSLSRDTLVGVLMRDSAAGRAESAEDLATSLERALGGRITPDDAKNLHEGLAGWAKARGDWVVASLGPTGVLARAPLSSSDGAAQLATASVHELVDLARRPAFVGPLRTRLHVRDLSFSTSDVDPGRRATVATFARGNAPSLALAWATADGEIDVAGGGGDAVVPALRAARAPSSSFQDDPGAAARLGALGQSATFAVIARPSAAAPPLVFAWGRKDGAAWARADVAPALLRDLLRMASGL